MLKVSPPRPSLDAVVRGDGRAALVPRFEDEVEPPVRRLSRVEAEALRARQPVLSPWRVVLAQVAVGIVAAAVGFLVTGSAPVAWSALYGAAVVALPSALMARGATSRLGLVHPLASAASLLTWSVVKLAATVGLLIAAPRVVDGLAWPVLLLTLVLCLQTYWLALLWRPAARPSHPI